MLFVLSAVSGVGKPGGRSRAACTTLMMLLACADRRTAATGPVEFERIEYQVGELAVAPQVLTIDRAGHARYQSHTNWHALERPEIGTYEMTLLPAELRKLDSALANPPFVGLPDHRGKVHPGDRYRRIRVSFGGANAEKLVGTKLTIDPALQTVLDRLDAIVVELVRHPRGVLRVELRQPRLTDRSKLSFVLTLSAVGTEPVTCRNPVDLMAGENGSLSISIWPDKPESAQRPEAMVTARPAAIRQVRPIAADGEPVLELRPGESATFQVDAVGVAVEPGTMLVRVSYANFVPRRKDRDVLVGELLTPTVSMPGAF